MSESQGWNALVVLVECSVNLGSATQSQTASRVRDLLLVAAHGNTPSDLTPRSASNASDNSLYVVIKRAELEEKGGNDAKSLAAALRQRLKQDRIKVLARRQKESKHESDDIQAKLSKRSAGTQHEDCVDNTTSEFIEEHLEVDDTIRVGPSEEDLNAARKVLGISDLEAAPDKIYLLSDYPSTAEEASFLIASATNDQVLDVVLELRGPVQEVAYTAPVRSESQSTLHGEGGASKSISGGSLDHSTSVASFSPFADLVASAASLPVLTVNHISSHASLAKSENGDQLHGSDSRSSFEETRSIVMEALAPPFDGSGPSLSSPVIMALRTARAEAKGPGWRDIVFMEMDVAPRDMTKTVDLSEYKPLALLDKFSCITRSLAMEKHRFLAYVRLCEHVRIPRTTGGNSRELEELMSSYNKLCQMQPVYSIAAILEAMVGAIASEDPSEHTHSHSYKAGETRLFHYGDRCGMQAANGEDGHLHHHLERDHAHWRLVPTPGGVGRQQMPRWPGLDNQSQNLLHSQYATFHSLSVTREELVRSIQMFERMLTDADPPGGVRTAWDFSDWTCLRPMDEVSVPQQLGTALAEEPLLLKKYMPRFDKMLVALHRRTPIGRKCKVRRSAFAHTNLRPTFSEWPHLDLRQRPCIYDVDAEPLRALEQDTDMFFPCDGSVIRVERLLANKGCAWCTVNRDGHRFGLRQNSTNTSANFFATFEDGGSLQVLRGVNWPNKPDKLPTMVSEYTCPDGLRVQHCSNGVIRMSSPEWSSREVERIVQDRGTVVSFLTNGQSRVLYASGDMTFYQGKNKEEALNIPMHDNGKVCTRIDFESGATVVQRFKHPEEGAIDGEPPVVEVLLIHHLDGTRLVCHADGTRILTSTDGVVRVEAPALATVKIQAAAETVCYGHSVGGRVDISRGGHVLRSSTLIPDATVVQIEYDTRVTAKVNGHLRVIKPDGTSVHVTDEGKVSWSSWDMSSQFEQKRQPDEEMPDPAIGCFLFDCDSASLRMQDAERNIFELTHVTNSQQVTDNVSLSGSFDPVKAVINNALRPRLFILDGKGSGWEFVQPEQLERERMRIARSCRGQFQQSDSAHGNISADDSEARYMDTVKIDLSSCLGQLKATDHLIPKIVHSDTQFAHFEASKTMPKDNASPIEKLRKVLVDTVLRLPSVSEDEREQLLDADVRIKEWRSAVSAKENRFNVDDPRSEDAVAEERKIQVLISKERKKLAKAAAKARSVSDAQSIPVLDHALEASTLMSELSPDDRPETASTYGMIMHGEEPQHEAEEKSSSTEGRPPRPGARNAPLASGLKYVFPM